MSGAHGWGVRPLPLFALLPGKLVKKFNRKMVLTL